MELLKEPNQQTLILFREMRAFFSKDEMTAYDRFNFLMRHVFFYQTDLVADVISMPKKNLVYCLETKRPLPSKVVEKLGLTLSGPSIDDFSRFLRKGLDVISFMDFESPIHCYKYDILSSIRWNANRTDKYQLSKVFRDHDKWFNYYHQIISMHSPSPQDLMSLDKEVYNFYLNLTRGQLILNDWKIGKAIEIIKKVGFASRTAPRKTNLKNVLTDEYFEMFESAKSEVREKKMMDRQVKKNHRKQA